VEFQIKPPFFMGAVIVWTARRRGGRPLACARCSNGSF
jgi:hypothetical protein